MDESLDDAEPLVVVDIEVPAEAVAKRLDARRVCGACGAIAPPGATACVKCGGPLVLRKDDDAEVVRERLRVYERDTLPVVEFYRRRPTYRAVDGDLIALDDLEDARWDAGLGQQVGHE